MNNIAVVTGYDNETTTFECEAMIKVFSKKKEEWHVVQEIPFESKPPAGIDEVRETVEEAIKQIKDCRIIVLKKVSGVVYHILESMAFNIWEVDGQPQEWLDELLEQIIKEQKEEAEKKGKGNESNYFVRLGEGHFLIDLKEIQEADRNISSKQLLLPILKGEKLRQLDILCTHIPPWMACEVKQYGYTMKMQLLRAGNYKVTLSS